MKRKKTPASSTASTTQTTTPKRKYNFVKTFGIYLSIFLVLFAAAFTYNHIHKSPFSHTVVATANGLFGKVAVVDNILRDRQVRMLTYGKSVLGGYWGTPGRPSCFTAFSVMDLALYAHDDPKRALVVGLGTGIFAKKAAAYGVKCDVVEIDPVVVKFAKGYFGFTTKGTVYTEDAEYFIDRTEIANSHQYDIIIHDIFSGGIQTSLYTQESLKAFETTLTPNGIFVLNYVGIPYDLASKMIYNTLLSIWGNVRCIVDQPIDTSNVELPMANLIFFASRNPIKFDIPPAFMKVSEMYSAEWIAAHHLEFELKYDAEKDSSLILNANNHQELVWDEKMKDEFWLVMQELFDLESWNDILNRTVA